MPKDQMLFVLVWGLKATWLLFIFAYGACLGSLTNVIVYRTPLGLSIVSPPSRCPNCNTKLTWRDNIPVLGWIFLKGKCRYCRTAISPEYPIVEAAMGLLFVAFYAIWYLLPTHAAFLGIDWGAMKPAWAALNPVERTWPEFVIVLLLVGSLFAMTLVDAKTFTIPIALTWFPALVGLLAHPIHAAWVSRAGSVLPKAARGWSWAIATPGDARWDWVGLCIGGMVGLGIGLLLLRTGKLGRSFADYGEWEAKAKAEAAAKNLSPAAESVGVESTPAGEVAAASGVLDTGASPSPSPQGGGFEQDSALVPAIAEMPNSSPELWMEYPYARREMWKELQFLTPCLALMAAGWFIGKHLGGVNLNIWNGIYNADVPVPFWLRVLTGVLQGYLIGGGVVWGVRIFGSLGFGREAMGLGDVHLMAGVGACVGWIDATLGFFGAAFVGLAWAILARLVGGKFQRMLPYGPFLAISTVLVLVCKPLIVSGLALLTGHPVAIP